MKRENTKHVGYRIMALVLALLLLVQAAPLTPISASAEEIAAAETVDVNSEPGSGETAPETLPETEATEESAPETEATEPAAGQTVSEEETAQPEAAAAEESDPYALLAQAAEGLVEVSSADQLTKGIPQGSTYVLTQDITMDAQQQIGVVAGTLDGKGHTITLSGKPLAKTVTGTVQNLNVAGTAEVYENEGAVVCQLSGGKVLNVSCSVECSPKGGNFMGGIVGSSENGQILNCYFTGSGIGPDYFTVISGIMGYSGNDGAPSQVKNCYYTAGINVGGGYSWNRDDKCNGKKKLSEMKTPEFVELLNTDITDTGYIWAASEGKTPVLSAKAEQKNPQITKAEELPTEIPAGVTYELAADITLGAEQQISKIDGILDGKGHTITLNGEALAQTVTGKVQNLLVAGTANLSGDAGAIACSLPGGMIQNCGVTVDIKPGFGNVGGLVGNAEGGKIYNCFFAGTGLGDWGFTEIRGIFGIADKEQNPAVIKNCYFTVSNVSGAGAGGGWNRDDASNGKKKPSEMKEPAFVDLLNATNVGGGYLWAAAEGALPKLVPGGTEPEHCDKTALEAVIKEAQNKKKTDYTPDSWAALEKALTEAKNIYEKLDATQKEAEEAEKALRAAIDGLVKKEREPFPVELPKEGVIPISSQGDFSKISGTDGDKYYQLTQDIVIEGNFWARDLAGVFDGNGHTITLRSPTYVFSTILETGVVQNLRIRVEGGFTDRQEIAPYAEKLRGGMIVNCISEVVGQHSAGFVMKMEGGLMANCLTMGHNRRGAFVFFQKSSDHRNTNGYKSGKFHNCYWSASNTVENITPFENLINCSAVGDEELRSQSFVEKLNSGKGQFGISWGRNTDGYPYFGQDHEAPVIDGSKNRYKIEFVWHDNQVQEVTDAKLILSPQLTNTLRFAGTFRLKGVPESSKILWSCDDRSNQQTMQLMEDGSFSVYYDGGGIVRATEVKADGSRELAAEFRVISASREIEQLRLKLDGKIIDGSATVQGAENKVIQVEAKYVGAQDFEPLPSYLVTLTAEKPDLLLTSYNTGAFTFLKPGTSKLTVTEKAQKEHPVSVTVTLTSVYVPITGVRPAISGRIPIHYRNSMGSGQFISLSQTVFVEPGNASYRDNISVTSSDSSIAEYGNSSYTPKKSGTVTFTASIYDNGRTVTGSSEVSFYYLNPLSKVEGPAEPIVLEQGHKQFLPLTFHGQPGSDHQVTEPELTWTFDKKGIVSIQRPDALMQIRDTGGPDDGNWVASTKYEVRALRPGTVVATGTPVDTSGGAKPVVLTITVNGNGEPVVGFDIPKFIETGKQAATDYLNANNSYSFGEEWTIFTLLRAGVSLPQDQLQRYYDDVETNVRSWKSDILATEVERVILALNVMGRDITDVGGVNLVERICNHPALTKQGSNSLAWALIALDMNNTPIDEGMKWSRERIVAELLTYQNADGGFGLDKTGGSGVDTTAMSLQALARYQGQPEVAEAVERGVGYLAAATEKNLNLGNAESIAQIIITLAVLNRDLVQAGFGDEMENIMSVLADYMVEGQGFQHTKSGQVDKMATTQAMQALCAYERFLNGDSSYWDLKGTGPIADPATKVMEMIEALPETVGAEDAEAVKAARDAYEALTDAQKDRVRNLDKLLQAEKALAEILAVQRVVDAINALPESVTLADAHKVQSARAAYDALSQAQQAKVTNLQKLKDAEAALKALANPQSVMELIHSLPDPITLADQEAVKAARAAYELLDVQQQAQVTNLQKLQNAEKQLEELLSAQKVQQVMDAIDSLPEIITLRDEKAVQAARAAYKALTDAQKAQVKNIDKLIRAETAIRDRKAAAKVETAISWLPDTVSLGDREDVQAARDAYNTLSQEQKALVGNLSKLEKAERDLADLDAAQSVMAMIKNLPVDIAAKDQQAVKAAREAYEALPEHQQKLVLNLYMLERAERTLAEKLAIQAVVDAINALPETITRGDKEAVEAARAAYDRLTQQQKEQIGNLSKLEKAEKDLKALRKPGGKPGGNTAQQESNVVEATAVNGKVSANQLANIQGKDLILRIRGTMGSGGKYVLSVHGKDIVKAEELNVELMDKGLHEEEIHKLSENPEIFRFAHTGAFPCPIMVEKDTALEDGPYLLLRYDTQQRRAVLVSRVQVADGKVQFIVQEGGEYFLAKKASGKTIAQLEEKEAVPEQTQPETQPETKPSAENTQSEQTQQKGTSAAAVWLPILIVVLVGDVVIVALRKRKEHKGE